MYNLKITKLTGGNYIDSRQIAGAIGKRHDHLLRDIRNYLEIMRKSGLSKNGESAFFLESKYYNAQNKETPCFLLSKMGCELVANKLAGERGVMFTVAYITRFNELEAAEREAEIQSRAKPKLSEFTGAAKTVLNGLSKCYAAPDEVMKFLRGVYEPLGIKVLPHGYDDCFLYYTATEIADLLEVYSESGRPHGHAVSAIISKLENTGSHAVAVPYGLVGVTVKYDCHIIEAVRGWLSENNYPREVPYNGYEYHIYYARPLPPLDNLGGGKSNKESI